MNFRLIDLIVLCCVFVLLSGMTVKAIQTSTEDARKILCQQNMAKLAKGVIQHDQTVGYLPPLATVNNHPGWNLCILPYIEQQAVYDTLVKNHLYDKDYKGILANSNTPIDPYDIGNTNIAGSESTFSGAFREWYRFTCATSGTTTDAFTKNDGDGISWADVNTALSKVAEYRCPTRQPIAQIKKITADQVYQNSLNELKFNNNQYEQSCMRGATGDYAAGIRPVPATDQTLLLAFNIQPTFFSIYTMGPDGEFNNTKSYQSITDRANVWMFGEKYVPQFAIEHDTPIANIWNGGVHRTYIDAKNRILCLNSSIRAVGRSKTPITITGNEVTTETDFLSGNGMIRFPANFEMGDYLWGSLHPGSVNMAIGDGSIQSVNTDIAPEIFNKKWEPKQGTITPL